MDSEFLELIKTFEKTVSRLEKLDLTLLSFKDIIENLRGNLDELVEMVQLEKIVELSEQSITKLKRFEQQLNDAEAAAHRFANQVDYFSNDVKDEGTALADDQYLYQLNEQTQEIAIIAKNQRSKMRVIEGLKVKKIGSYQQTTFVLNAEGTVLYHLSGENKVVLLEEQMEDFVIYNYKLYGLADGHVFQYHLLTHEKRIIFENIANIQLLPDGKHLLCETINQEFTFFEL